MIASVVYASMPRIPQELKPSRTQAKQTQHPTPTNVKPPAVLVMQHMTRDYVSSCRQVRANIRFQRPPSRFGLMWCCVQHRWIFGDCYCSGSQEVIFNNCYCSLLLFWVSRVVFKNCYCSESQDVPSTISASPQSSLKLVLVAPLVWTTTCLKALRN